MSSFRGTTELGTNDIRSYFQHMIDNIPFTLPTNHSHSLYPTPPQHSTPTEDAPTITLDNNITPHLYQQHLEATEQQERNKNMYSLPWGANAFEDIDWNNTIRYVSHNVNGLPAHESEFAAVHQHLFERHSSVSSLIEHQLDTNQHWIMDMMRTTGKARWNNVCIESSCNTDKVRTSKKYGGTMTMIHGDLIGSVVEKGNDPEMGRWSYITLQGKANRRVTFISAYRVCNQTIASVGARTAYFQQWHHLRQKGIKNPDPRQQVLDDLAVFIKDRTSKKYEVILGIDGNESLRPDNALATFFANTGLYPFHEHLYEEDFYLDNPIPNTHKRGQEKIDFQAGTLGTLEWAERTGLEGFDDSIASDHRSSFTDFNKAGLLNGKTKTIDPPAHVPFAATTYE